MMAPFPPVEELCRIAHDAYERAAVDAGWETQEASRVPWDDVPAANKATMRAAMDAVWTHVCRNSIEPIRAERDALAEQVAQAERERDEARRDVDYLLGTQSHLLANRADRMRETRDARAELADARRTLEHRTDVAGWCSACGRQVAPPVGMPAAALNEGDPQ